MLDNSDDDLLGTWGKPVFIEDDDFSTDHGADIERLEQEALTGRRLAEWAALLNANTGNAEITTQQTSVIPSDVDQQARIEDVLEAGIAEVIDLTGDDALPPPGEYCTIPEGTELAECRLPNGVLIRRGLAVELLNAHGNFDIKFLKVRSIMKPVGSSEILVRGLGFTRTRQLRGMLPPKLNEVAMVAELRSWDRRQWEDRASIEVKASDILCVREIRITNTPFPEHRFERRMYSAMGRDWVEEHAPLVCRYRLEISYHGASEKPYEWAFVAMGERDADPEHRISDRHNLCRWRGGKAPGGSHNPNGPRNSVVDVDTDMTDSPRPPRLFPGQQYTAGDVFAGAGGASRGMERAGVKLLFAVDHWKPAAESLRSNFPGTRVYNMEVTEFITSEHPGMVDLLHLSPPCQFWSPAHTVPGRNDEANIAVLFACTHLLEKFKPRIFTVEQTFGIFSPKFEGFFNTFLNGFTRFGYSVRWKVVPLANYGIPQLRKRLIMIGSAPGEKLAPFPPVTHSKSGGGGLLPWITPKTALARIPRGLNHPLHRPAHLQAQYDPPRPRWDPTRLASTITTNGGQNYHWSGTRDFTLLEYAVLQGFPTWHRFEGSYIKKQIGNAFAPSVVRLLYSHLIDWLLVQDGLDPSARRQNRAELPPHVQPENYVCLDGDDGEEREYDDDEAGGVVYLGSRKCSHRLSRAVRRLNMAALEADKADEYPMIHTVVDDLSDTETLRGESSYGGDGSTDTDEIICLT